MLQAFAALFDRELDAVKRQVLAYPDDRAAWTRAPGCPNPGGTLVLHVAGNLQHYIGRVLGGSGYVRDRGAEFSRTGASRSELVEELDAAREAIRSTFQGLGPDALLEPYPEPLPDGRRPRTDAMLLHYLSHTAYHLGQLDYHRRVVADGGEGLGALDRTLIPGDEA